MSNGPYRKDPLFLQLIFSPKTRRGENGKKTRSELWNHVLGDIDAKEINPLHRNSTVDTTPKLQVESKSYKYRIIQIP